MKINNYFITDTSEKIVVDYNKTLKDWFDTILVFAFGVFLLFATYLLLDYGFKTTSYIVIAAGFIFVFIRLLYL